MSDQRTCCRAACPHRAVATLTYVYAESIAVVGPLSATAEPHSWDLCESHANRFTAPRGWELLKYNGEYPEPAASAEDEDLTALAEAVRRAPGAYVSAHAGAASRSPVRPGAPVPRSGGRQGGNGALGASDELTTAGPGGGVRRHLRALPDPESTP